MRYAPEAPYVQILVDLPHKKPLWWKSDYAADAKARVAAWNEYVKQLALGVQVLNEKTRVARERVEQFMRFWQRHNYKQEMHRHTLRAIAYTVATAVSATLALAMIASPFMAFTLEQLLIALAASSMFAPATLGASLTTLLAYKFFKVAQEHADTARYKEILWTQTK
jgi:hypothetical protein